MCATALAGDWWAGWSRWKLIFLCKWQLQTAVISAIWRLAELRKVQFCTENRWQLIAMKTRFRIRPLMTDLQVLYTHKWHNSYQITTVFSSLHTCVVLYLITLYFWVQFVSFYSRGALYLCYHAVCLCFPSVIHQYCVEMAEPTMMGSPRTSV